MMTGPNNGLESSKRNGAITTPYESVYVYINSITQAIFIKTCVQWLSRRTEYFLECVSLSGNQLIRLIYERPILTMVANILYVL